MIVLGVSGDGLYGTESRSTVEAFAEQTGVTFPLLLGDRTYFEYEDTGSISPFPFDVIVDREGTVRYMKREYDLAAMQETIERLLSQR